MWLLSFYHQSLVRMETHDGQIYIEAAIVISPNTPREGNDTKK